MKKLTTTLLLAALVFLSAAGLFSCRAIKKTSMQVDSTVNRSSQASEKWDREIITDYGYPDQIEVPDQIRNIVEKDSTLLALMQFFLSHQSDQKSKPVIIRQTIRDSGEKQQSATEQKTVQVEQKQVGKPPSSPWLFMGYGALGMLLLLIVIIGAYKVLKARILSAIPR